MRTFKDFVNVLTELIQFFKEANVLEQEKLDAAKKNRATFVEECMKKEQVIVLKLRGFDKTREEIQRDIGFEGLTFQEILAKCTADQHSELSPLFKQLGEHVKIFKETSQCAKDIIEINLHNINMILAKEQGDAFNYTDSGAPRNINKTLTNRTI